MSTLKDLNQGSSGSEGLVLGLIILEIHGYFMGGLGFSMSFEII
jgi:hypothetical protein